ncbi:MAG: 3',5'-cyclic-nucleotide phosphodiesterase [Gammaproteobacteria bacterium]|nr:3',5'-cyclic-nucleotide phosphodiesterase [Gammaproteobacteria bacterium]
MKIRILGASGGIGAQARTTSLLVDRDILIDAGTGVGDLTLPELRAIDHVFLTHSHLDHVTMLPFLLDTVGVDRERPVKVHAQEATLDTLRRHLFNGQLWPDFSRIPTPEAPFMTLQTLPAGGEIALNGRTIRSIPVNHVIPAVGYLARGAKGSLAFSGDTTVTDEFWKVLSATGDLRHVIIETSFMDEDEELSRISKHLCPAMLAGELKKLKSGAQVHITHLMPGREDDIMREIARHIPHNTPRRLERGQIFEL